MKRLLPILLLAYSFSSVAQVTLFDPIVSPSGGTTCQDFESTYDIYDARIADDFIVPTGETWYVDSIAIYGSYSATASTQSGVVIRIYQDNGGNLGSLVFLDSITTNVDPDGDGTLTPYWENPISLSAGHYWLVATARKDFGSGGGQWYWGRENTQTGYPAKFKNPGNGFSTGCTSWINLYDCTALSISDSGMLFRIFGCYGPNKPATPGVYDTTICANANVTLTIGPDTIGNQSNVSYIWNTGATTQTIQVTNGGYFFVYVEDSVTQCGVQNKFYVDVEDVTIPSIDDDTTCKNTNALFQSNANCPNCVSIWTDGSTGIFFGTDDEGWVTLTILDTVTGCSRTDSAYLTVESGEVTFQPDDPLNLCEGQTLTVSILETLTSYEWQLFDGLNWTVVSTNATADIEDGGMVRVLGTTPSGCAVNDTAIIIDRPSPNPIITIQNLGTGNVRLKGEPGYVHYQWSNGDTTANTEVTVNGLYTLTVTDEYGCIGDAFVNVFTVGMEDDPITAQVQIYPNPTNGLVNVSWPQGWLGVAEMQILNLEGRVAYAVKASEQNQQLNLQSLSAGVYMIRVESPDGVGHAQLILTQ